MMVIETAYCTLKINQTENEDCLDIRCITTTPRNNQHIHRTNYLKKKKTQTLSHGTYIKGSNHSFFRFKLKG